MLAAVRERIEAACRRSGRDPGSVKLIAVTKGKDVDEIERLVLSRGCRALGENRIQEWREKERHFDGRGLEWHFIGNLQRNKVKYCLPFHTIHSLNSLRLAEELQRFGARHDHRFRVLLEVNVSGEATKQGLTPTEASELAQRVSDMMPSVELAGLMTMAPWSDDPESVRPVFAELRKLRDKLGLVELSMGMSGDFEVAIEEGATMVRVGSALFDGAGS